MDSLDSRILNIINKGIPLTKQPYLTVAETVGISERGVIDRITKLLEAGVIRRIGAVIDPHRIGWHSTLCAADIPEERLHDFSELVGEYVEVTHNYVREGHPNCWFTVIAPSSQRLQQIITEIETELRIEIKDLPSRKVFKIRVAFDIS
jgi:siroheme decarboxylase